MHRFRPGVKSALLTCDLVYGNSNVVTQELCLSPHRHPRDMNVVFSCTRALTFTSYNDYTFYLLGHNAMHPCKNMTHVAGTCDFQSMLHSAESAEKSMSPRIQGDHSPVDGSVPRERQALKQPMCETTMPLGRIIGVKVNLHASTIRILRELSVSRFCHQEKDPFSRRHIGHYSRSEPSSPQNSP